MGKPSADGVLEHSVAARIISALESRASELRIADVRIGLGYTAVRLDDGKLGLAYTYPRAPRDSCSPLRGLRPLAGRQASDLLRLLPSPRSAEATVGLATANALTAPAQARLLDGDVLTQVKIEPQEEVAMVGHFEPLVAPLRARARSLTVFEMVEQPDGELRPATEAAASLRRCQVAFITATSIINHTIDELLEAAGGCREVAVLGASTPLVPEAFADTSATLLSGVSVSDPEPTLQVVSEGGGMRFFKPFLRKVNLRLDHS